MVLTMKTIFITIEAKPQIASVIRASTWVTVKDRRYEDTGLGGWTGFYDWLRPKVSEVIGLRYSPFEEAQKLRPCPETLRDQWINADTFYGVLQRWRDDFEAEWLAAPKVT
jgi:hypothetical protein